MVKLTPFDIARLLGASSFTPCSSPQQARQVAKLRLKKANGGQLTAEEEAFLASIPSVSVSGDEK